MPVGRRISLSKVEHMFWSQTRRRKKLEDKRQEVLDVIRYERWQFELMQQRAGANGETVENDITTKAVEQFSQLEQQAVAAKTIDEFDDLMEKAEGQGTLRAYLCPTKEIVNEGTLAIDVMAEWSIPKTKIETLRSVIDQKVTDPDTASARGALRAILDEKNSWAVYTDEYEDTMKKYTLRLVYVMIGLLIVAGIGIYFRLKASSVVFLVVILCAGAAGSCVSVMQKMPLLDVSLSGELDAYGRRIWSRVATGTVASLVGCALLSWGILPIALQGQTFSDVVSSCSVAKDAVPCTNAAPCTIPKLLILLAVAILFGFSERTLTSAEQRVLGG